MHVEFKAPPIGCMEALIIVILLVTIGGSLIGIGLHLAADPTIGTALRAALP